MKKLILICILGITSYQKVNAMDMSVLIAVTNMNMEEEARQNRLREEKKKEKERLEQIERDKKWNEKRYTSQVAPCQMSIPNCKQSHFKFGDF